MADILLSRSEVLAIVERVLLTLTLTSTLSLQSSQNRSRHGPALTPLHLVFIFHQLGAGGHVYSEHFHTLPLPKLPVFHRLHSASFQNWLEKHGLRHCEWIGSGPLGGQSGLCGPSYQIALLF